MTNKTIDEDYEVDEKGNIYQPEDSTSPYATQVEMKVGDPYNNKGDNSFLYSTETIGNEKNSFGKRENIKRNMKKSPITNDERAEYKKGYINQFSSPDTKKAAQEEYDKMSQKEIDKRIEDNSNRIIHDVSKSKWENDVLKYVDNLWDKNDGNTINTQDYIDNLKDSPQWKLYGSDKIIQQIRNKTKKYNDSVKETGYNKTKESLADIKQTVKNTSSDTKKAVADTAKETQEVTKSESKDIQDKIDAKTRDIIEGTRTDLGSLNSLYLDNPKLETWNKDSKLNELRANTGKASKQLEDAQKNGTDESYLQALQQYRLAVQAENAMAAQVATSDDYLNAAASGMENSKKITNAAKQDTSWLPKGIIKSYLDGDFGKKAYVQQKDDNGNLRFDEKGNPIYKMRQVKKLDKYRHQIYTEKPVLNDKGEQVVGLDGKPKTQKIYQYEDKPVEKYPSQAKHALGYYLMDTIGNMLTNATNSMPGRSGENTKSAWKQMQEEKAASYQKALNTANASNVTESAETARKFGKDTANLLNEFNQMGLDTSKLQTQKSIEASQIEELQALKNAGQYMNKMDPAAKQLLFDAMLMTSDDLTQAEAALLKKTYMDPNSGMKETLNSLIKSIGSVTNAAGKVLTGITDIATGDYNGFIESISMVSPLGFILKAIFGGKK